jgi:hypothetical protein
MPIPKYHVSTPRGLVVGHHWKGAIKSNGPKPTIYPHTKTSHHIPGFQSKPDHFGRWSSPYYGRHR